MNYPEILWNILGEKASPSPHETELIEKAIRFSRLLAWIPGIQMVALCNSLSFYAGHEKSDIDLFIVSKPGVLWFVRAFSTLLAKLTFQRRFKNNIEWLICLSFFATTSALNMEKIAIEDDYYFAGWIAHLRPIISIDGTYEIFTRENVWIKKLGFNFVPDAKKYLVREKKSGVVSWLFTQIALPINWIIRLVFLPKNLASYHSLGKPWWVIISDEMLKFHPDDRRKELREQIYALEDK